jgi:hypothetical protein
MERMVEIVVSPIPLTKARMVSISRDTHDTLPIEGLMDRPLDLGEHDLHSKKGLEV